MSINLPLKIKDTFGNLQQLTTSEENYLAYQLGLNLSESVDSDVAALTLNDSISNLTVGTFTDTFYNEPVGTNPGTSLSIGNSTTTLYQTAGIADSSGSEWRIPVGFKESDGSFREMPPSSFDSLIDRLVQKVLINDFPGAYRLDSAGFSDTDWQPQLTDVFIDTQTDSTNKNYNIFQRKSITAPDEIKHMSIKRDGGRTGSFQGIQETTVAQIKYTLGQRAKTYIVESGIGTYKLRTSGEGVPTPGTWVAKGIAVDTRKTTADADYSKQYIGSYEESVDKSFT